MKYPNAYSDFQKVRQHFIDQTNRQPGDDIDLHNVFKASDWNWYEIVEDQVITEDAAIALMCDSMETKLMSYGHGVSCSRKMSDGSFFFCVAGYQTSPVMTKFDGLVEACLNLPACLKHSF